MPNLQLPTNITPGTTATFEADVEAAWGELNQLSRDTGIRDITSMLINGWTAGTVRVRRIRNRTYWEFFNLNGSAATSPTLLDMTQLTGFQPSTNNESEMFRDSAGAPSGYFRVGPTTFTCPAGYVSPGSTVREMRHRCSTSWPATLPGSAVSG